MGSFEGKLREAGCPFGLDGALEGVGEAPRRRVLRPAARARTACPYVPNGRDIRGSRWTSVDAASATVCAGQNAICGLTCTNARSRFPHGMQRVRGSSPLSSTHHCRSDGVSGPVCCYDQDRQADQDLVRQRAPAAQRPLPGEVHRRPRGAAHRADHLRLQARGRRLAGHRPRRHGARHLARPRLGAVTVADYTASLLAVRSTWPPRLSSSTKNCRGGEQVSRRPSG